MKELREQALNADINALADVGLLDEDTVEYLISFEQSYEPGSRQHYKTGKPAVNPENTEKWRRIARQDISQNLRQAVRNGRYEVIEFALGFNEENSDVPFQEALSLENIIHGDEFRILVFTGGQGGGKSYLAYTIGKYKKRLCDRDGIAVRVVTNSLSAVEANDDLEFVGSPEDLLEYRLEHPGEVVFIFDEASSFFDSKAAGNAAQMAQFVPFLRRMRKFRILPIIVSHRAMDIGTDVRKLESVVFVDKPTQDKAVFYEDEKNGELEGKMFEISGYSTDERYEYESDDPFISWKWEGLDRITELMENPRDFQSLWEDKGIVRDLKEKADRIDELQSLKEERDDLIRQCSELEYTQEEIADFASVSRSRVQSVLNDTT
ncbi:hypothetical protein [Haloarcula amylolytica]|uniref:hypothetical protein n=1 Tax=Haloarcula amylolytica TaxID=396317 RepID=UPI003C73EA25